MLKIQKNIPLASYTTLRIGPAAEFFAVAKDLGDLREAITWAREKRKPLLILGGGSNILISKKFKGLVLKNEIRGMEIVDRQEDYALVEAKSGESWTRFVDFTLDHGLYGLENLFLIYGTVGAAPVQNIGAYGVELKDVFYHLRAIDLTTGHEKIFSKKDCRLGYRDSVFKNRLKGKYFIYAVTVKLKREPDFRLDYGSIREELLKKGIEKPYASDLIKVITEIRNAKLPSPGLLPNAGSYFKNVTVTKKHFQELQKEFPILPGFPASAGKVKIPAGWLIEQAGYKGKRVGPARMYEKQALVLVHDGRAQAKDVLALARQVKAAVRKKFGLALEEEINVI